MYTYEAIAFGFALGILLRPGFDVVITRVGNIFFDWVEGKLDE